MDDKFMPTNAPSSPESTKSWYRRAVVELLSENEEFASVPSNSAGMTPWNANALTEDNAKAEQDNVLMISPMDAMETTPINHSIRSSNCL